MEIYDHRVSSLVSPEQWTGPFNSCEAKMDYYHESIHARVQSSEFISQDTIGKPAVGSPYKPLPESSPWVMQGVSLSERSCRE